MYNVAKYGYGLGQKSLYWRLLTFSGLVNIFLNTLMHTQRKTNKKTNKQELFEDKFLSAVLPTHPARKCDLPEGVHNAALAEKVH